jgi:hypothetical protein
MRMANGAPPEFRKRAVVFFGRAAPILSPPAV